MKALSLVTNPPKSEWAWPIALERHDQNPALTDGNVKRWRLSLTSTDKEGRT
ncbi:hypothetical protein Krac_0402 [Ktedonobacter racemifer DSM 44963]|uniref:Uncharacterized protein n=1 Tax=Ktedonobacter racemifer DSM 44963 TaxID=485913 RepID=D6U7L9_KTERA|nr:hypothetical protein Krac_0402 [Ktedonobacter racemifer DSM 44963]